MAMVQRLPFPRSFLKPIPADSGFFPFHGSRLSAQERQGRGGCTAGPGTVLDCQEVALVLGSPALDPPAPRKAWLVGLLPWICILCFVLCLCRVLSFPSQNPGQRAVCGKSFSSLVSLSMGQTFWKVLSPTWLWVKAQVPCREVLAEFFPLEAGLRIPGDPCPTYWVLPCTWQPPARALGLMAHSC